MERLYVFLRDLDRRWVFLMMFLAVMVPILLGLRFPEDPSPMVRNVFKAIEELREGDRVLMAFDYDPGSKGELDPMAAAFVRHCAEKKLRMYFITLWPFAGPMIQRSISILNVEYPELKVHEHYVNLDYRAGNEAVIKSLVVDLRDVASTDATGVSLDAIPMTRNIKSIQDMQMIINVSAGDPGTKQWVQYAATPYNLKIVAGCTGIQAPQLYPYIPGQMIGVLGAIKSAAEYEQLLIEQYPRLKDNSKSQDGLRRMGPQLVAHLLIVVLIILANVVYFMGKKRGEIK